MKVEVVTETEMKVKNRRMTVSSASAKSLTLDDIENKMVQLAMDETTDVLQTMINERKIAMLEKVANLKIHRLQLKELEKQNVIADVKPLEIKFISSKTKEQEERIERIDNEILSKTTGNHNA